jgi:hypothetical protein
MSEEMTIIDIERAKTAVANGQLFNVLMFGLVLIIAVHVDPGAIYLAFAPILSIGAAYLADGIGYRFQRYLSWASIVLAVIPFIVIFYI